MPVAVLSPSLCVVWGCFLSVCSQFSRLSGREYTVQKCFKEGQIYDPIARVQYQVLNASSNKRTNIMLFLKLAVYYVELWRNAIAASIFVMTILLKQKQLS